MSNDKYELISYYSEFCLLLEEYNEHPLINNLTTALLTDITSQNSPSENSSSQKLNDGGSKSEIEDIDSNNDSSAPSPVETEGVVAAAENIQPENTEAAIKIQSVIRGRQQRAKTANYIEERTKEERIQKRKDFFNKNNKKNVVLTNKFNKKGCLSRHIRMLLLKLEENIEKGEKPNNVVFYIEDYFGIIKTNLTEEVNDPNINKVFYLLYFIKNFFFGLFKIFSYLKNTSEQEEAVPDSASEQKSPLPEPVSEQGYAASKSASVSEDSAPEQEDVVPESASREKKKKKFIRKQINLIDLLFNSESNNSVKSYYNDVFVNKYFKNHYGYKSNKEKELLFKDDFETKFKEIFPELPKIFKYKLENILIKVLSFFYKNDLNEHFNDKKRKENAIIVFDKFFSDHTLSQNEPIVQPETLDYLEKINQELQEVIFIDNS